MIGPLVPSQTKQDNNITVKLQECCQIGLLVAVAVWIGVSQVVDFVTSSVFSAYNVVNREGQKHVFFVDVAILTSATKRRTLIDIARPMQPVTFAPAL